MAILKLRPSYKNYIWGGDRLQKSYHKECGGGRTAESWELSCHPDGPCYIAQGPDAGKTLREYLKQNGKTLLGKNCERFEEFPVLIKLIDAGESLSLQVHPDDSYARSHEGQPGKTEMWYILDAQEDSYLYYGFSRPISREEFRSRINSGTLLDVLNKVPVVRGDIFFIEAGTVHAIGSNLLVAEVQQSSNITYRIYDYDRTGTDGKPRPLHIPQALEVARTCEPRRRPLSPHIAQCPYFTVDRLNLDGSLTSCVSGHVGQDSFLSLLITDGSGTISNAGSTYEIQKGDSIFLSAGSGSYGISGDLEILATHIPPDQSGQEV